MPLGRASRCVLFFRLPSTSDAHRPAVSERREERPKRAPSNRALRMEWAFGVHYANRCSSWKKKEREGFILMKFISAESCQAVRQCVSTKTATLIRRIRWDALGVHTAHRWRTVPGRSLPQFAFWPAIRRKMIISSLFDIYETALNIEHTVKQCW